MLIKPQHHEYTLQEIGQVWDRNKFRVISLHVSNVTVVMQMLPFLYLFLNTSTFSKMKKKFQLFNAKYSVECWDLTTFQVKRHFTCLWFETLLTFLLQCEYVEEIFLEKEMKTNLRAKFTDCWRSSAHYPWIVLHILSCYSIYEKLEIQLTVLGMGYLRCIRCLEMTS